ncbi:MAG: hypothetical protein U0Q15_05445 [Kineosporiaceae bacterium]
MRPVRLRPALAAACLVAAGAGVAAPTQALAVTHPTDVPASVGAAAPVDSGARSLSPLAVATISTSAADLCATVATKAGFTSATIVTAVAIAMAESSCNPSATGHNDDSRHTTDRGLWQINDYWHSEVSDTCAYQAQCNANAAYDISSKGTDWDQWSTWDSGSYRNFLDQAQAAVNRLPSTIVEGDFVQVAGTDPVYRIAGGAPLYVSSWAKVSDVASHPVKTVSQATFNALPRYPKDGTFLSEGDGDGAWRIAGGAPLKITNWAKFPAGSALKALDVDDLNITSAGTGMYTHTRTVPLNGTFLGDSTTTAAYITVGGAPMRIYDWADYPSGSALKAVEIDPATLTGSPGMGLLKYPANGSFIGDVHSSAAYRIAGGAPLQMNDWNTYTDAQKASAVEVDTRNFTGTNLLPYPADGTMISDKDSSRAWVVAGGAAITLFDWAPYSTAQKASAVEIDTYALDIAGTPGSHLRATPANGTFISAVTPTTNARKTFRIIGGAPLYVASTTPYGTPKVITVNEAAVLNAGTTTVPTLTLYPANGTLLQTTTGTKYQISNGRALPYTGTTTIPTTNTIDTATITNAGGAYPYNHLAK